MLGVVVQIEAWDPVARAPVSLFAGSHDLPDVCHLEAQDTSVWWPALATLPTLRYDLFDGAFDGQIIAPSSSLTMRTEPWPDFGRYILADARLRLWTGAVGDSWSDWTLRFNGRVSAQPSIQDGAAAIAFAVDDRWLDTALLPIYAGTTGSEGGAALKGQPKPLAIGAPRYVPGTLVDPISSIFQVSAFGFDGIDAALERLARYGPSQGDFPTFAALEGADLPPGTWATCKAGGFVRFGAPPAGQISFLVRGDRAGEDGWVRRPGSVIRRLADLADPVSAAAARAWQDGITWTDDSTWRDTVGDFRVDYASLAALDAIRPVDVSIYLDQQVTAREVIQQLAASLNCVAGVSWTGQLFVIPVAIGEATLTLAADGTAMPPVKSVKQIETSAPWRKLAITAERSWTVHALADIAFTATLIDLGPWAATTTYREGNIVQHEGSTWLYSALVPSAGNEPPDLPITENAFWRVLASAGQDGTDGVDGRDGLDGSNGIDGTNGQSIHVAYADSADGTLNFTTGEAGGRTFIGVYTDTNPGADSANPASYGWTRLRGLDGANGVAGPGGYVHFAYANNATGTLNFHLSDPTGRTYLGVYTDQVEADSADPGRYSWSLIKGADGAPGLNGSNGIDGAPGANGQTSYVHFAFADAPDGSVNFTTGEAGGRLYIGTYTDFTAADSGNPAAYTWSRFRGADGANGTPGAPGANGQATYVHIAYANSANGQVDFSTTEGAGRTYIGTYTDGILADSSNPALYTWSLIKGTDGINGAPGANGTDGFTVDTETTNFTQPVFSSGASKPAWTGASGTIRLTKGGQRITAGVTYAVLNNSGVSGLALNGDTFSFAGSMGDVGAFTIRATFGGVSYDKVVSVKKVYDGEAAFTGAASIQGTTTAETIADVAVPAARQIVVSGVVGYNIPTAAVSDYQGQLSLYWRNVTDGGAWNLLGTATGSTATVRNLGTAQEPDFVFTGGSVSAAFTFTSPSPAKQIGYRALVERSGGSANASLNGTLKLEVRS